MRVVILSVFVCLMLMAGIIPATDYNYQKNNNKLIENSLKTDPVNAPVWEVGDTWTYKISMIDSRVNEGDFGMKFQTEDYEVTFEVIGNYTDYYEVNIQSNTPSEFYVYGDFGDGIINISGNFDRITNHNIKINKADLGITEPFLSIIYDNMEITKVEQPYLNWFPYQLIPTSFFNGKMYLNVSLNNTFAMLSFPLFVGKIYNLLANSYTVTGLIKSDFLGLISKINEIIRSLGGPWRPGPKKLSDLIHELLPPDNPVLRIEKLLEIANASNTFETNTTVGAFICTGIENITIPPGTYPAYNITILGGVANAYYSPDLGNIIKIIGNLNQILPFIEEIDIELIDTNYS